MRSAGGREGRSAPRGQRASAQQKGAARGQTLSARTKANAFRLSKWDPRDYGGQPKWGWRDCGGCLLLVELLLRQRNVRPFLSQRREAFRCGYGR